MADLKDLGPTDRADRQAPQMAQTCFKCGS